MKKLGCILYAVYTGILLGVTVLFPLIVFSPYIENKLSQMTGHFLILVYILLFFIFYVLFVSITETAVFIVSLSAKKIEIEHKSRIFFLIPIVLLIPAAIFLFGRIPFAQTREIIAGAIIVGFFAFAAVFNRNFSLLCKRKNTLFNYALSFVYIVLYLFFCFAAMLLSSL